MNKSDIIKLKHRLPIIPGINGREDYLNSAVLVLLMVLDEEYHFVFQKRSQTIRQGGEICFPGGKYDKRLDKNTQDTALRETAEEIGVLPDQITIIGALDLVIAPIGVIVEPYLGLTEQTDINKFDINTDEVERIFTLPVSFFKNTPPQVYQTQVKVHPSYIDEQGKEIMLFPGRTLGIGDHYIKPWGNGRNTIFVYQTEEGVIWGLTARIIYDVVQRLSL
ncbi:NUDIX hydrolase [Cellulosilyticum sp. I15G10I2]|uniref:NUDIX hydrolase n=1 Tax=Cellulosilyticum sp. I15G10I2 TaxID=1892843 RepID=UPI00085CA43C|nr:CoA pyrophosphatase [Cellulosilyticum sp. I15G10I2]